jgi:ABC-type nitrate/sulfonate/bicarbonate transport system permease component
MSGLDVRGAARQLLPPLAGLALLWGAWSWLAASGLVRPRMLPAPGRVWDTLARSIGLLLEQAQPTFWAAVAGIFAAALLGIGLGIAVSFSRRLMQAIYPTIVFFQLIPKVALAPVFLIWFGHTIVANIIFSVFIAFFPVLVATIAGLQETPPTFDRLGQSLMMPPLRIFLRVKLIFALPQIFNGLRIGVTFAVIGVVLGEFITVQAGLGYIILFSANNFETALLLSAIVVLCGVGIVLFAFFLALEAVVLRIFDSRS